MRNGKFDPSRAAASAKETFPGRGRPSSFRLEHMPANSQKVQADARSLSTEGEAGTSPERMRPQSSAALSMAASVSAYSSFSSSTQSAFLEKEPSLF